jgi:hypothetical protein
MPAPGLGTELVLFTLFCCLKILSSLLLKKYRLADPGSFRLQGGINFAVTQRGGKTNRLIFSE